MFIAKQTLNIYLKGNIYFPIVFLLKVYLPVKYECNDTTLNWLLVEFIIKLGGLYLFCVTSLKSTCITLYMGII